MASPAGPSDWINWALGFMLLVGNAAVGLLFRLYFKQSDEISKLRIELKGDISGLRSEAEAAHDALTTQIADMTATHANQYARRDDLAAMEGRLTSALSGISGEVGEVRRRVDRLFERSNRD